MSYKNFVKPEVYFVGATSANINELTRYLQDTDQEVFFAEIVQAKSEGLSDGEILCSFYAKLCYASLSLGKNKNITKVRAIRDNMIGTIDSGHYSVLEHCQLNFVVRDCSRVFTHELVRHRHLNFSQTSGRYVRSDVLNLVIDPILEPANDLVEEGRLYLQDLYKRIGARMEIDNQKSFDRKKKITSAMRRLMPNGQSNEIGFSINLRSLREIIQLRTSRHSEWEIRLIFGQVYDLINAKYPTIFADAKAEEIDGLRQITFKNKKI